MANIYEITSEYLTLLDMMEDPDTDPQAFADTLEGLQFELETKAENYGKVIKQLEADAKALKDEEDRLSRRRTTIENNIKRMKQSLLDAMTLTGQTRISTNLFKFSVAKNGGKLPLIIDGDVPEQFKVVRYENNNEKIREYLDGLQNKEACTFAHYGETGTHLNIR